MRIRFVRAEGWKDEGRGTREVRTAASRCGAGSVLIAFSINHLFGSRGERYTMGFGVRQNASALLCAGHRFGWPRFLCVTMLCCVVLMSQGGRMAGGVRVGAGEDDEQGEPREAGREAELFLAPNVLDPGLGLEGTLPSRSVGYFFTSCPCDSADR